MKQLAFFFLTNFYISSMFSQNYLIDFESGDINNTLDSILIVNLSSNDTLQLESNFQLILTINETEIGNENLDLNEQNIYPNPSYGELIIGLNMLLSHPAFISITDLSGRIVYRAQINTTNNKRIKISNIPNGIYVLSIGSSENQYSKLIISQSKIKSWSDISIDYHPITKSSTSSVIRRNNLKISVKSNTKMLYNEGERLLLTGYSGNMKTVVSFIPINNTIISFNFYSCTDRDSNNYKVVQIGKQIWMAENLKYLPSVVDPHTRSLKTRYYYVYGYNGTNVIDAKATSNYTIYGVLYNWIAAMAHSASSSANPSGVKGVCPDGWHLPSNAEWTELTDYLGASVAGDKLKETGTYHWNSHNTGTTNETGFTALPGGGLYNSGGLLNEGGFNNIGSGGIWWSATQDGAERANYWYMYQDNSKVNRYDGYKNLGFSVRCVRD